MLPALTRSPTCTATSSTVPAWEAGISMTALSDSRVTTGSCGPTWSPGPTSTSVTGTSA